MIFDCVTYKNEDIILDLRLNILDEFVDKFIIVEATKDHAGNAKKLNFNKEKFKKFEKKIRYIVVDDMPEKVKSFRYNSRWWHENIVRDIHQRNQIMRGLYDAKDDDLIVISDIDEIPNLRKFKYNDKLRYTVFCQKNFSYKINLINKTFPIWHGTKGCKKKYLKTPQWLRNKKIKKRTFLNFFNIKWNVINNGGWHFSYLMTPDQIREKIMSFGHAEFNHAKFTDITKIEEKIYKNLDLYDREQIYEKVDLDNSFPLLIHQDKKNLSKWII